MASKSINVILNMKDKMSEKLVKVTSKTKELERKTKKANNTMNKFGRNAVKSMDKMIAKTAKFAALGASLAGGFVIKVGFDGLKELDEGAAKIKSIAKNALELQDIKKGLLKTSNKTGIDVAALSETQYSAISSGVKAAESLDAAVTAAKLSKAGFTDAESALKILTSTMNVYGFTGQEAMQNVSDKLLITQNLGVTTVDELANSMGSLTPIANSAGTSINDLMAGMASLTKNGLKTEEAVTSLKGIMTSVISPTKQASDMAKKLGIDFSVSAIESKGFAKFLEEVKQKTGGNTETMGKLFGNVRALSGALILSGKGFEDFNTSLDAMKNSAGATDEAFKIMENTVGAKLNKLKNIAKNTATNIINTQSGAIGELIDNLEKWYEGNEKKINDFVELVGVKITETLTKIKEIFDFIQKHKATLETMLTVILSFYAAIKVVMALKAAVAALNTVFLLTNATLTVTPIGWLTLAMGALIAVGITLVKNWEFIKTRFKEIWEGIGKRFKEIVGELKQSWESFTNFLKHPIKTTISVFKKEKTEPVGRNALGTSYWKGGLTQINERGGEIVDLPSGTRIIPHDLSKTTNNKNVTVNVNINGANKSTDEIISEFVPKLKLAMANM